MAAQQPTVLPSAVTSRMLPPMLSNSQHVQPSSFRSPSVRLSSNGKAAASTHPSAAATASQDEPHLGRVPKKLQKKRKESFNTPIIALPERLRDGGGEAEREEDVMNPNGDLLSNMNQSILGLITAAGSQADFTDRFEGQTSDEEDDERTEGRSAFAQSTFLASRSGPSKMEEADSRQRKKISHTRLLRSVPGLARFTSKSKSKMSKQRESRGQKEEKEEERGETPSIAITSSEAALAPVMSSMLEARAHMAARPSFDLDRLSSERSRGTAMGEDAPMGETGPTGLARKLQEIFDFDEPEEVIAEYPCCLLQNVLLQGYLYLTARHVAFYAYLPKKSKSAAKSGYLCKSGLRNAKYSRYWFRLKGDVLSYYRDPQNLYFPSGHIDLRYGISADITDKDKEAVHLTVITHQRPYHFRADSAPSAKEWVKSLQRIIFRTHNDGDSVKISLPSRNIIDIEETQILASSETCKIRVIDNDETFAIDEYFFAFFTYGREALGVLRTLIETSAEEVGEGEGEGEGEERGAEREGGDASVGSSPNRANMGDGLLAAPGGRRNKITEGVRATLSPLSPTSPAQSPRASCDISRSSSDGYRCFGRCRPDASQASDSPRPSLSDMRRSSSKNRAGDSRNARNLQGSSDSHVQSENPSQASASAVVASGSEEASASLILRGSDVFHNPTMRRSISAPRPPGLGKVARPSLAQQQTPAPAEKSDTNTTGYATTAGGEEPSTANLPAIARIGGFPLQKANAFMGYLDRQSKRMSNLLATESMGYVEKVSGMWKGGKKHYDGPSLARADEDSGLEDEQDKANSSARFRAHFALPDGEQLKAAYFGYILRVLPLYGKLYISDRHFCFRSLLPGTRTKVVLPLSDIENVDKEKGFRFGYSGLVVVIRGHEELFFEFGKTDLRDDCAVTMHKALETNRYTHECWEVEDESEAYEARAAMAERDALQEARADDFPEHDVFLPRATAALVDDYPNILFDDPRASILNFKPSRSLKITCVTIGSRGDVQPYIALCRGLLREGHRPRIATHGEFKEWVEGHGIEFALLDGDPSELMRICIENGTFSWSFMKESHLKFRGWLDDLLKSAWEASQGSDLLIESPSAIAGIHIAEALQIPYFRAFTMPWTRTRAYPHAFIVPAQKMGGAYNYITYVMFENIFWTAQAHQVNRWRNNTLKLPNTSLEKMQSNKAPFLYNFSPYVVPPPLDFSDWIRVTGYWFLDEADRYQPPKPLVDFIDKAREDGKKIVYVGFGSIIVQDPAKLTRDVIDAVLKADVRCILSRGWSDRVTSKAKTGHHDKGEEAAEHRPQPMLPPEIFPIKSVPHDWLFRQIDAAAHHGGSGTTGASLRAGIPTVIRPFFGDQFFFGNRVEDLNVGICLKKWGVHSFARALWEATHNERMILKARVLGEQIRKENGVDMAIQCIYRDLEYATNLIKTKAGKNARREMAAMDGADFDHDDVEEESWTFVGADVDVVDALSPDVTTKLVRDPQCQRGGQDGSLDGRPVVQETEKESASAT